MSGGAYDVLKNAAIATICPTGWLILHMACVKIYNYVEGLFDCDVGNVMLKKLNHCPEEHRKFDPYSKTRKCRENEIRNPKTKKCVPKHVEDTEIDIDE